MKKERFSINWGKGTVVVVLLVVGVLLAVCAANLIQTAHSIGVAVDWGDRVQPPCPPKNPNCNPRANNSGETLQPVLVAVDWGDSVSCNPNAPKCKPKPCNPKNPKCKPGSTTLVDWGD